MTIEISEAAGVRSLHFGTPWVQGAVRVARPWALELEYTRDMLLPLLLRPDDWPQRVLMVGLGSGSLAKFLYRHRPHCMLHVVELDPQVIQAAHQHFKLPAADARLQVSAADGFEWVKQDTEFYDLILLDAFDLNARAHRLESAEFYAACQQRLRPEGWIACNLLTLHRSHAATRRALASVFGNGLHLLPPLRGRQCGGTACLCAVASARLQRTAHTRCAVAQANPTQPIAVDFTYGTVLKPVRRPA